MTSSNDDLTIEQHHEQLREDLAGYALGGLEPAATARVAEHVAGCAECRQTLAEYQNVLLLLPLGLPASQPSPGARALLISRSRADSDERAVDTRRRSNWWPRMRIGLAGFAAALLLVAGAFAWQQATQTVETDEAALVDRIRNDPQALAMPMAGSDVAPGATANLFIELGDEQAALVASGLPQPPEGHEYQFWFVRPEGTRISGGVFDVDRTGGVATLLDAPTEFSRGWSCGVSEEPNGGSAWPTGRNILRAAYSDDYDYTQ